MSVVEPQLAALVKDNVKLKRMCSRNGAIRSYKHVMYIRLGI